jgi:AraC-like DNA-binding protein
LTKKDKLAFEDKPHIANHFLQAAIRSALRLGFEAQPLLDMAGIPPTYLDDPQQLVSNRQLTALTKALWRYSRDEFMGMAPNRCKNGTFALMAEFCLGSKTLGGMLDAIARFYGIVSEDIDIQLLTPEQTDTELCCYRLQLKDNRFDPDYFLQEFLLLMWQRFSSWMVGQQVPFIATDFSYSPPPHGDEYKVMYTGELRFDQPSCGFWFHPKHLQLPIVRSLSELKQFLAESPAYILHRPSQDKRLQTQIRTLLSNVDYRDMPNLEQLSRQLHMTPRNIARKLHDEGTSFSQIKSELRRDYATQLLTTEHLSIAEVSERTGFAETASFCRAFKRWTGMPPSQWNSNRYKKAHLQ